MEQGVHSDEIRGKLSRTSKEFRTVFLMAFTKELIKNTRIEEFFELEKIIKGKKKLKKREETLASLEKKYGEMIPSVVHREKKEMPKPFFVGNVSKNAPSFVDKKTNLTQNISQLPPEFKLNLGRLNPLLQDINVLSIECNGSEESLIVRGSFGTKVTNIILGNNEISSILKKFSEATKIPLHEGIFKASFEGISISAIVSDVVGSKFIIRKVSQGF